MDAKLIKKLVEIRAELEDAHDKFESFKLNFPEGSNERKNIQAACDKLEQIYHETFIGNISK